MNSAAVKDPDLVADAVKMFRREKISVTMDARRNEEMPSGFELVVSGATKPVGEGAPFQVSETVKG